MYIVGEGRAGKTCVANSLMGIPYRETESTVGISRYQCESAASHTESDMTFDCDVKTAAVISDSSQYEHAEWTRYEVPERLLETVIAAQVQQTEKIKINAGNKEQISLSANVPQTGQSTIQAGGTVFKISSTTASSTHANPSPAKARVAEEIKTFDEEFVAKCLSSNVSLGSDLIISMYDFGGQSVFNAIHHLFLHRGVYLVCFNMEDMISCDEAVVEQCLTLIDFWLNSIYIHTYDKETYESSSAILIGTRKDKVPNVSDHSEISRRLFERFGRYRIVMNDCGETSRGRNTLFFFPVDNTKGKALDSSFPRIMNHIETKLKTSEEVRQLVPLTWLRAVDVLTSAENKSKLALDLPYTHSILESCDIPSSDFDDVLQFLYNAGTLMWVNEEKLRDIVILNPIEFFVVPVTTLICKLKPTETSSTCHTYSEIHQHCKTRFYPDWRKMEEKGIRIFK